MLEKIKYRGRDSNPLHSDLIEGALQPLRYRGNHSGVSRILAKKKIDYQTFGPRFVRLKFTSQSERPGSKCLLIDVTL